MKASEAMNHLYQISSPDPLPEGPLKLWYMLPAGTPPSGEHILMDNGGGMQPALVPVTIRPSPPCALRTALEASKELLEAAVKSTAYDAHMAELAVSSTLVGDDAEEWITEFLPKAKNVIAAICQALSAEAGEEEISLWIPLSERRPTKDDGAIETGWVLWSDGMTVDCDEWWIENPKFTHWTYLPPPSEPAGGEVPCDNCNYGLVLTEPRGGVTTELCPKCGGTGFRSNTMDREDMKDVAPSSPPQSAEDADRAFEERDAFKKFWPDSSIRRLCLETIGLGHGVSAAEEVWHAALAWRDSTK